MMKNNKKDTNCAFCKKKKEHDCLCFENKLRFYGFVHRFHKTNTAKEAKAKSLVIFN